MNEVERRAYLRAMEVDVWLRRDAIAAVPESVSLTSAPAAHGAAPVSELGWDALQARVSECTRCDLHQGRTQTVFGVGNPDAAWLVIGEAPGAEEDRRGEPFVGRAGKLLDAMLKAVGLRREDVYIANMLKCRPPSNRDPRPQEVVSCEPYLMRQIALLNPKLILAVGRIAAQNLLEVQTPIGKMRGQRYTFGSSEIPVVVTYHPAYLLRSPGQKYKAWEDLQMAKQIAADN